MTENQSINLTRKELKRLAKFYKVNKPILAREYTTAQLIVKPIPGLGYALEILNLETGRSIDITDYEAL